MSMATATIGSVVLHAIIPMRVRQKGGKSVTTYVFYDNGSSSSFATKALQDALGVTGRDTLIQLHTMLGENCFTSQVLNGLIVSDIDGENDLELPVVYTRDDIPVDHRQIPRPEVIEHWPGLQNVAREMHPYMPQIEIGLLIGSNCPAAMEPLRVVPTNGSGPFAVLYRHGWTVNGPIGVDVKQEDSSIIDCHRICVFEAETTKEILTPASILKSFELDFSNLDQGAVPDARGHSVEDQKFLISAQEGMRFVDGHYELPLPFRSDGKCLPNNYEQAVRRAQWQCN